MDESEEPWTVSVDELPPRLIITCKKPEERDIIVKKLKWTVVYRGIKADLEDDNVAFIKYKTIQKRDKALAMMLVTMQMLRKTLK